MKSGLKKNIFARKFKFTSCQFGSILASICVSLEQKISAFGIALRIIKLQLRFFFYLYRRFDSVYFVCSFIYLFALLHIYVAGEQRVSSKWHMKQTVVRETKTPPSEPDTAAAPASEDACPLSTNARRCSQSFPLWFICILGHTLFLKRFCLPLSRCLCPILFQDTRNLSRCPPHPNICLQHLCMHGTQASSSQMKLLSWSALPE